MHTFLQIRIRSTQRWGDTKRHGVTKTEKKVKTYKKSNMKEYKDDKCLLTLNLKPFRSQFKEKHSAVKKIQGGKNFLTLISL